MIFTLFIQIKPKHSIDNSFARGNWIFEIQGTGGNSFEIMGEENVTINLFGICSGDVNGSYIPEFIVTLPLINTIAVSNISVTTSTGGGNITSDGGASIIERGICWSSTQNPTTIDSHTSSGTGTGSFISSITGLTANTTYFVRAYATNSAGVAYGNEISFTTIASCPTAVTDYDNNTYNVVLIGSQCWMKENLKAIHYSNGTAMVDGTGVVDFTGNDTTKFYFDYGDNPVNTITYGKLYTWVAAMNGALSSTTNPSSVQGICPTGWHLPSALEWDQLTDYLGGLSVSGGKMKEEGITHWNSPNTGADNSSGFTGLPGGVRYNNESEFSSIDVFGYFWSATDWGGPDYSEGLSLNHFYPTVQRTSYNMAWGLSIRCLRD